MENIGMEIAGTNLKDFKNLDCSGCGHYFGHQHRYDPAVLACSAQCVATINSSLNTQTQNVCSPPDRVTKSLESVDDSLIPPLELVREMRITLEPVTEPERPKVVEYKYQDATWSPTFQHGIRVRINFLWNLAHLTVYAVDDEDALTHLSVAINNHVVKAPAMSRCPVLDELVVAPYQGMHYRGRVTKVCGEEVTIRFLDYGDDVTVKTTECRELSEELFKIPMYGLELKMEGVPANLPFIESAMLDAVADKEATLEKRNELGPGLWEARLWYTDIVAEGCHWAGIILGVLKKDPRFSKKEKSGTTSNLNGS